MFYPIDKYRFVTTKVKDVLGREYNKVIALSTYAGKTVRGIAMCSPEDTFSLEKGKELAAARCSLKVAEKRNKRAMKKFEEAESVCREATQYWNEMQQYLYDSQREVRDAKLTLLSVLKNM